MTLIAQITDPHLRDDGIYASHDPAEAMRRAFARIAAMEQKPDAIILSGDIIDRSAAGYDAAIALLRDSPVPLLPMPGNHDRHEAFRNAFGAWADFAPDHLSFALPVGDLLMVGLDSNLPGGRGGVDGARLDWLARILAGAQRPVILALHHPPFPTQVPSLDRSGFARAADLAAVVAGSAVSRVIAGHSHRGIQSLWAGVMASTAAGIGHSMNLGMSDTPPRKPTYAPPGFELHKLASGTVVSHQIVLS
ncbi:MAG: metallophosphoesterase [Paracoccaceae bacterium]